MWRPLAKTLKKYAADMIKSSGYSTELYPDFRLFRMAKPIQIWTVIKSSDLNIATYFDYLSGGEKIVAEKFRFPKDRANYVLGRAILRFLAGGYLKRDPKKIQFAYNKYGKPEFADPSPLSFNIAHSEDAIVFGFSKSGPVGIDVEKIKTNFDVLEIARRYFSPAETEALETCSGKDQIRAFYRCWTRKESFIKAKGKGLSFPLDAFTVSLDNDLSARLIATNWKATEKEDWQLFSFVPSEGYLAAATVYGKNGDIEYREWDEFYIQDPL